MNTDERNKKMEELQQEIFRLQKEERNENINKVLPFLIENCKISYRMYEFVVEFINNEDEVKFIELIESKQDKGFNHFGCDISEGLSVRFDDGKIHIIVTGKRDESLEEMKKLGLKLDFSYSVEQANKNINREILELKKLKKLQEQYS